MLKSVAFLFVGFFVLFLNQSAFANDPRELKRFYYKLSVLSETSLTCEQQADMLKARFASISKTLVVESLCKGQNEILDVNQVYRTNKIILTYMSERELVPYTAYFGNEYFGTPGAAEGIYTSYKACLTDMQSKVTSFETLTGLSVVGASCQRGTYTYDKNFVLKIDGLSSDPKQKPNQKLYAFAFKSRGSLNLGLLEDIKQLVAKIGGEAVTLINGTVFYYSKNPISVGQNSFGIFEDSNHCNLQVNDVKDILTRAGSKNHIALCVKDVDYPATEYLEVVSDNSLLNTTSLSLPGYFSFEECMDDKSRAMDEATSRGFKPLGAICKKFMNGYEMQIFRNFF